MKRILIIADDLSGAAEMAGIAVRFGLSTSLHRHPTNKIDAEVTVLDTDSRSMFPSNAAEVACAFATPLASEQFDLIYKKTDSVLRGNPRIEIESIARIFGKSTAPLIPQNPSRGRVIRDGKYFVNNIQLHQTAFANDPEHPAKTSDPYELLGRSDIVQLKEADSRWQIDKVVKSIDLETQLPAGGADFFESIISRIRGTGFQPVTKPDYGQDAHATTLFICGSASAYAKELITIATKYEIGISRMIDDANRWSREVIDLLGKHKKVLMTIDRVLDQSSSTADRLRKLIAQTAKLILLQKVPDLLTLEGGATASSVCIEMGWSDLKVDRELAPGIVCLNPTTAPHFKVLIKPGSYRWPDELFQ